MWANEQLLGASVLRAGPTLLWALPSGTPSGSYVEGIRGSLSGTGRGRGRVTFVKYAKFPPSQTPTLPEKELYQSSRLKLYPSQEKGILPSSSPPLI